MKELTERSEDVARKYAYKQKALFRKNVHNPHALTFLYGAVNPLTSTTGNNLKLTCRTVFTAAHANVSTNYAANNSDSDSPENALRLQVENMINQVQALSQNPNKPKSHNDFGGNRRKKSSDTKATQMPDGRPPFV